jgi:hypothetical protein
VDKWAYDIARQRDDAEFELVDVADFHLPLLGEPVPPMCGQYGALIYCASSLAH